MQQKDDQWTDGNPNAAAEAQQDAGTGVPDRADLDQNFAGSKPGQEEQPSELATDAGLSGQEPTISSSDDQTDTDYAGSKPGQSEMDGQSLTDDQRRARDLGRAAMRTLIGGSDEE